MMITGLNMHNSPLVTIGIPVYNGEMVIGHAIDSVLAQTCQEFELIIIDDGSTDDTWEIIKKYQDPRITAIREHQNKGIANRLNQQIGMAKGRYYARMDADDIMFPERLQKQLDFMLCHPDADVIGAQTIVFDEDLSVLGLRGYVAESQDYSSVKSFLHPTVFGKTEWFRANPYNELCCGNEDFELWSRTSKHSAFYHLNTPLLFYQDKTIYNVASSVEKKLKGVQVCCKEILEGRNTLRALYLIVRGLLAIPCIAVIHLLHLDRHAIRMRNQKLSRRDKEIYQHLLDTMVLNSKTE